VEDDYILHKVLITEEAVFDFENSLIEIHNPADWETDNDWRIESKHDLPLARMPKLEIKRELEEYIQGHSTIRHRHYFFTQHYDDTLGWIVLFVKKTTRIGPMQNWEVVGICRSMDWDEESEDRGWHRSWYETKFELKGEYYDWVEARNIKLQMEEENRNEEVKKQREYEDAEQREHDRLFGPRRTTKALRKLKQNPRT